MKRLLCVFSFLLLCLGICNASFTSKDYANDSMIYGFIVPHSHDDVGWLLTIDEYFELTVQHIYNQVVEALLKNPERRFIAVEVAFIRKWWEEVATVTQQQQMINLVTSGQLEFIIGGVTMHDEACPTYSAAIDQMTEGHRWIFENFGVIPHFGWQIDPFGHSNVVHRHFAEMGFDATVLDRLDLVLKNQYTQQKFLEFVWQPSHSAGNSVQIFTHVLENFYATSVGGLNWEGGDPPVTGLNIKSLADSVVNDLKSRQLAFRSNIILFPWGDDFQHYLAVVDFENMDKVLAYINEHSDEYGVKVQYATLGEFFKALHSKNLTWDVKVEGDFFPYQSDPAQYWTGYYSSRGALKGYIRSRENVLRTAEILNVISASKNGLSHDAIKKLAQFRLTSGYATHHDAVSGTAEPWVNTMYAQYLSDSSKDVVSVMIDGIQDLAEDQNGNKPSVTIDEHAMQGLSPTNPVSVLVFNNLGWTVNRFVSVPVFRQDIQVIDANSSKPVPFQVLPSTQTYDQCDFDGICGYPNVTSPYRVYFGVQLPPLGYSTYVISVSQNGETQSMVQWEKQVEKDKLEDASFSIENHYLKLTFSNSTGQILSIINKVSNVETFLENNFFAYVGDFNEFEKPEGAYVFHPVGPAYAIRDTPKSFQVFKGKYVQEVRQVYTDFCSDPWTDSCGISQIFRLYNTDNPNQEVENFVDIITGVGPVGVNLDVVSRFTTAVNSNQTFYTDNNCFETIARVYNPSQMDVIGGNFYPVTCGIFIRDSSADVQFSLLVDRTRSGSSLEDGKIEIMVHRRDVSTDFYGPLDLDDTDYIHNMQTRLLFDTQINSANLRKKLQYSQQFPPTLFFSFDSSIVPSNSALKQDLPQNVHLLTLSLPSANASPLFRLAHIYEKDDGSSLATPVSVDVNNYLRFAFITQQDERYLSAQWPISHQRWTWLTQGKEEETAGFQKLQQNGNETETPQDFSVTLNPTQIRTYFVTLK